MPRIPNIQKFRGDNSQSFLNWIRQFEAQLVANGIEDDRKRDVLLCCCDEAAFMILSPEIANDDEFTYQDAKDLLERRYTGTNYKRTLESKFRSLRFRKGMKINQFCSELYTVIRELYDIHDENAIQSIAISHVVSNLDDAVKGDVKLLQLSGNVKLEKILELAESKMQNNYLQSFVSYQQQQNTPYFQNHPGASNSISNFNPTSQYTENQYDGFPPE